MNSSSQDPQHHHHRARYGGGRRTGDRGRHEPLSQDADIRITAGVASGLSGFSLAQDLSDTLVIPITSPARPTPTGRSRWPGARSIIAIVNRRQIRYHDQGGRRFSYQRRPGHRDVRRSTKAFIPRSSPAMSCPVSLPHYGMPDGGKSPGTGRPRGNATPDEPGPR